MVFVQKEINDPNINMHVICIRPKNVHLFIT